MPITRHRSGSARWVYRHYMQQHTESVRRCKKYIYTRAVHERRKASFSIGAALLSPWLPESNSAGGEVAENNYIYMLYIYMYYTPRARSRREKSDAGSRRHPRRLRWWGEALHTHIHMYMYIYIHEKRT